MSKRSCCLPCMVANAAVVQNCWEQQLMMQFPWAVVVAAGTAVDGVLVVVVSVTAFASVSAAA